MTHPEGQRAEYRAEHMEVWAVGGIGEVVEGTDLGDVLGRLDLHDGDVVLVTSKVVSKAEGRVRSGDRAAAIGDETVRVVARRGPTSIVENRLGIVMAAAGVDASNVTPGHVVLLPEDPDASARATAPRGVRRPRPQRRRHPHRHRRAGLAQRPDRPGRRRGRHRATRRPRRDDRLLRQPARGHGTGRGRRARRRGRAGHRQARRPADLRRPRARRPGAACRARTDQVPGALLRPRAEDMFALGAREAVVAAVRGRDGDCFGTPGTTEEVQRAMESCGLAAEVDGVSVRVRLPRPTNVRAPRPGRGGRTGPPGRPRARMAAAQRHRPRRTVRGTTSRSHRRLRRLQAPRDPICEGGRVVKKNERDSRRAIAEQMRQEQARKERRRSLLILGSCVVVVLGLLGTAVFVYVQDLREEKKNDGTPLAELGVNVSAADCDEVKKAKATGNNQPHRPADQDPLPRRTARLRTALGQLPAGIRDPQLLHRRRPSRGRASRAQPRARAHDPLVRRHGEAGHRRLQGRAGTSPTSSTRATSSSPRRGRRPTARPSPAASTSR